MKIKGLWMGIIAIIFGILILVRPEIVAWLVGIYLIVAGVLALLRR